MKNADFCLGSGNYSHYFFISRLLCACLLAVAPSAVRDSASSNYKLDDFKSLSKKEIKSIMQVRIELSSFKSIAELLPK